MRLEKASATSATSNMRTALRLKHLRAILHVDGLNGMQATWPENTADGAGAVQLQLLRHAAIVLAIDRASAFPRCRTRRLCEGGSRAGGGGFFLIPPGLAEELTFVVATDPSSKIKSCHRWWIRR